VNSLGDVNTSWAVDQLRQFIAAAAYRPSGGYGGCVAPKGEVIAQAQVVEQILERVVPGWNSTPEKGFAIDRWLRHRETAQRAIAQLEREQEIRENLGELATDLSAASMHSWAWQGARSLWSAGHYRAAVSAAAVQVNAESQNKLARFDVSEVKLFQEAFSLRPPEHGKPRLRLMSDDGSDTFRTMHEGASAFAVGCYKAIRNPAAHIPLDELPEDEALEQLAALGLRT